MRDTGVDGNDEIEAADQACRIDEIIEMCGQIDDISPLKQDALIGKSRILLQADEGCIGLIKEPCKRL